MQTFAYTDFIVVVVVFVVDVVVKKSLSGAKKMQLIKLA